jgi:hypothetical protein
MGSIDSTILALTIMPAKELEHLFLRVLPGKRDEATDLCRALTDLWRSVIVTFLVANCAKKADTLQEQSSRHEDFIHLSLILRLT